jgi:oxygen-dependent protoporphyrinogen oxidase
MAVVIVGAGITGLTAALTLLDDVPGTDVVVLDAAERPGGKIATGTFSGLQVDCAADAFLARVPDGVQLCERLGLRDALVTPAARTAYLYSRGALRRFPEGLVLGIPTDLDALATSGVLSPEGVARAALDLTMAPEPSVRPDESVGSLVRRRLGDEVYDVLVGPLLSGVNAGDADWLSVAAGAPQFATALRDHGSLIAGARAQRAASLAADPDAPVFFGLPGGMARLVDRLAEAVVAGGGVIRTGTTVTSLTVASSGAYVLDVTDAQGPHQIPADAILLATPLYITGPLLDSLAPTSTAGTAGTPGQPGQPGLTEVAAAMTEVEYASAIMVTMAVPKAVIDHPLDASGFLVASGEGLLLTACSWASSKWAHLDSPDTAILRASAGRHHDARALELTDEDLVDALLRDLAVTMGVTGAPTEVRVSRWPRSLPQFRPGHLERVGAWRDALAGLTPPVVATGAGFEGLGLPACIRQGRAAAKTLAHQVS